LATDSLVGPKIVASTRSVRVDQPLEQISSALDTECDELYVRSLCEVTAYFERRTVGPAR